MSRETVYQDERLTYVKGVDHMLGPFRQLFDNELAHETPEGEGLIMDWSLLWGYEINITGESSELPPDKIAQNYIKEYGKERGITIITI